MKRFSLLLATLAVSTGFALGWTKPALAQTALFEPGTRWTTLHTPHFRIYHTPELAQKAHEVAGIAEEAHKLLVPFMGVEPAGVTEVVITDMMDELNSLAQSNPHRAVWLWLTPPNPDEGMSIGRYDQWLRLLFIHEYTHVLQFEHTPWLVQQLNSAAGGFIFSQLPTLPIEITLALPDLLTNTPSYFTEGLAVYTESKFTAGGRGLEGDFDMIRRMAFAENRVPTYDQIYGRYTLEWPMGGYEYTWGSAFIAHLIAKHGEKAPAEILKQYGVFPYLGFDNAVWRATGESAQSIYADMCKTLGERYAQEMEQWKNRTAKKLPTTKTVKNVTTSGRYHRHPVWLPDGTLMYGEAARNKSAVIYADKLDGKERQAIFNQSTRSAVSVGRDPNLIYGERDTSESPRGLSSFRDIFVYDREKRKRRRLTHQARVFAPQVSPDGTRIVGMTQGGGKTGLAIFDQNGRRLRQWLFDQNAYQFGNPVWSPDARRIAVAVWHAGTRDLWLVNAETGSMEPLWRDLALDFYPSWTPDGRGLVFTSDRQHGIFNLFVADIATRRIRQLTDLPGGAFDPAVSPDGKAIAYANYTGRGYDIQVMPFSGVSTPENVALRRPGPAPQFSKITPAPIAGITPYNGISTMAPSTWFPLLSQDESGTALYLYTFWQDLLREQTLMLMNGYGFGSGRFNYGFNYGNSMWTLPWSINAFEFPNVGRQPIFPDQNKPEDIIWTNRWQWRKSAGLSFQWPGIRFPLFEPPPISGQNWTFGLRAETVEDYALELDPAEIPEQYRDQFKDQPRLTGVNSGVLPSVWTADSPGAYPSAFVQWQRAQAYRRAYDYAPLEGQITTVGLEQGLQVSNLPLSAPPLLERAFTRFWADHRWYVPLPWGDRHSLAFRGTAGALFNRNGNFFMSVWRQPFGYQPLATLNRWDLTSATDFSNRMVLLRGHNFAVGNRVLTAGAEYRFPLFELRRGWGEAPLFINDFYGVVFLDTGAMWGLDSASFTYPTLDDTLTGTGAELRARSSLFQSVPIDLRVGFARGLSRGTTLGGGEWQLNWGLGSTF